MSDQYDSDIIMYIGPIDRPYDDTFIERCLGFKRKQNVILILTTLGGDPNAAYRMARCLQAQYHTYESSPRAAAIAASDAPGTPQGKFRLYVDTRCKSAGTILATGANVLMFSEYGELGPIDTQLRKGDEVGERSSGLTPMDAFDSLQTLASKHFEDCFKGLRFSQELVFSTKMACEVAAKIAVGLFGPIYGQIDPMRIGEFNRAMRIASDYGARLGAGNLKDNALDKLLAGYPSHAFVIDKREARELFKEVEDPTPELSTLGEVTRTWWNAENLVAEKPLILYLTTDDILSEEVSPDAQEQPTATGDGAATVNDGIA